MSHENREKSLAPETGKQAELLFMNGAITVVRRPDDYMAYVSGKTDIWDAGSNVSEAIGKLVQTWPLEVIYAVQEQNYKELLAEGRAELEVLMREDPQLAETVEKLRELSKKPGLLEAVLAKVEVEELRADPDFQQSIAEAETGDLTDITPRD